MVRLNRSTLPFVWGPIGPGALVAHASVGQRGPEQSAAIADPVVAQYTSHRDAVQGKPAVGAAPEAGAGLGPLVAQDLHIGQAGVVVDRGVQVVVAAA